MDGFQPRDHEHFLWLKRVQKKRIYIEDVTRQVDVEFPRFAIIENIRLQEWRDSEEREKA